MPFRIILDGTEREIDIIRRRPHLVVSIDGREHTVQDTGSAGAGQGSLTIGGTPLPYARVETNTGVVLRSDGRTFTANLLAEGEDAAGAGASEIRAPMPGAVISVAVTAGDAVAAGTPVLTIESMKLETVLLAPRDGTIAEVLVAQGDAFEKDQVLARLEEEAGEDDAQD
jgi:biotin carboxyl carrier protein